MKKKSQNTKKAEQSETTRSPSNVLVKDCDFILEQHKHSRGESLDPVIGLIYSDDHIRIWKMWDEAATIEKGKMYVRVDIWNKDVSDPD